jgi:assimilatory nitrate reductase catalytic subunit
MTGAADTHCPYCAVARARVTDVVRVDTVFMAFHWAGEGTVNHLTADATDPVSGMPGLKVCAVSIEPCDNPYDESDDGPRERAVPTGAGAAA